VTEVPISITVADASQLERQQVNTVNDLNRIAPSLEIQSAPGQNTGGGGAIRGIGTQTFSPGAVASVGVVVDQVSQGNANISDLFDVARIEVLKGPQGTLFGLTTSAGVINITTNKPEFDKVSVRVRTELSAAGFAGSKSGNQVVQGVANVPIADNAAIRVAGYANLRQGPDYNLTTGKYDKNETMGGRARLLWEPTDKLTVNLIGDYADTRTTNGGNFFTFVKSESLGSALAACGITAENGNRNYCTSEQYTDRIRPAAPRSSSITSSRPSRSLRSRPIAARTSRAMAQPPTCSAPIRCRSRCIIPISTARPTCSRRNCAFPRRPTRRWNTPWAGSTRARSSTVTRKALRSCCSAPAAVPPGHAYRVSDDRSPRSAR
jgi:outer membrane receptor protein involved in Fe transport